MNSTENEPAPEFPMANVRESRTSAASLLQSRMWWITLLCTILAAGLAYQSLPETGPEITIQFPQGHGLKDGDEVRFRGIAVGTVTAVTLSDSLTGVDVDVQLNPEGGQLNKDGTRFWIVRPHLSLTEISGLDTAVGSKYIGVSPGDAAAGHKAIFRGLPKAPPDELAAGGLELVLRSDDRNGLTVGAPVTWRGVDVGQVLSVGLSADARHVNTSIRIYRTYRRLVRPTSKFWITSGFGVDVGLSGITVNAESLTTIARGGISFITVPEKGGTQDVNNGSVYRLEKEPLPEWLEQASNVSLIDFPLPETSQVVADVHSSILGIKRTQQVTMTGLLISIGEKTYLMTAELPGATADGTGQLKEFSLRPPGGESVAVKSILDSNRRKTSGNVCLVDVSEATASRGILKSAFREILTPEDCVLVRTVGGQETRSSVIHAIDSEQQVNLDTGFQIVNSEIDFQTWNGAPAIAAADGKIIGILVVGDDGPVIQPYADVFFSFEE